MRTSDAMIAVRRLRALVASCAASSSVATAGRDVEVAATPEWVGVPTGV